MKLKYPIVNDSDQIIGYRKKDQAYKEREMLRSVQIFVYNPKGDLYIQKRGKKKSRYPNYYCVSVAGHVEAGETYQKAAIRELKEELGLKKIGEIKLISKEKISVGKGNCSMAAFFIARTDEPITLQKEEVSNGNFYTIKDIEQLILKKKRFTPSFLNYFKRQHENK